MEQGGEKWSGVDVEAIHPKSEKVGGHCFLAHKNLAEKVRKSRHENFATKTSKQQKVKILQFPRSQPRIWPKIQKKWHLGTWLLAFLMYG